MPTNQSSQPSLYELMKHIDSLVVQAIRHPEASQGDKATLSLGGLKLAEVTRRHMPKRLPMDPATLPAGARFQSFTPVRGGGAGWLADWDSSKEVAS